MDLTPYVDELQEHLTNAASVGGEEVQAAARRLAGALDSATRLVLLDALATAAGEISRELLPGSVDVRLRGRDPEFVVQRPALPVAEPLVPGSADAAVSEPEAPSDDAPTSRTTLRLSDSLKLRIEQAAAREGSSLNTWIVRALAAAVDAPPRAAHQGPQAPHASHATQPALSPASSPAQRSSSFSGWVR